MHEIERLRQVAREYYALCERARAVGVATSIDDPSSPTTVADLRRAVTVEEAEGRRDA
jgi:hypothetical protein